MAGNQRELQREERRAQKDRKNRFIIWAFIAIIIVILAVMKICEININSVKDRFTDENGKFTISQTAQEGNFPYNLDSSQKVILKNINNKLCALTPTSFTVLNSKNGEKEYSFDHGYLNPVIRSSGIYTLIYDQGAKSMRLDNTSGPVYEHENEKNIFCADTAKNGNVVLATSSAEKKCDITVYSKSLKEIMKTSVSYGYVISVAINDSGSKIAFVAVNSENAQLKARLFTMNVGSDDIKLEKELPSGNVLDLKYSSGNAFVVADTYVGVVINQKKYKDVYKSSEINTVCFTYSPSNDLILVYSDYNSATDNKLVRIKSNGKIKDELKIDGNVKSVSASSSIISVLTSNSINSYSLGSFKDKGKTDTDDSIKSICRMGSNVFVHRQSLVDRIEAKD